MAGISTWEFVLLAVIALLVLGPDKLPKYAADAARTLRQLRRMATDARAEVSRELGPEFRDIGLDELNPRSFVRKHLWADDDLDLGLDDEPAGPSPARSASRPPAAAGGPSGSGSLGRPRSPGAATARPGDGAATAPPYDDDAT